MSRSSSLEALQAALLEALHGGAAEPELLQRLRAPQGADREAALQIYRRARRATLVEALRLGFPVCERLLGAECFAGVAAQYAEAHPSRHGDLDRYGAELPSFLARHAAAQAYAYLPEVARFEWRIAGLRSAAPVPALDRTALLLIDAEDFADWRLQLVPRAAVFVSSHPAVRIWQAHQRAGEPDFDGVDARADRVLAVAGEVLQLLPLDAAACRFHHELAEGATLAAAAAEAFTEDEHFDFEAAFAAALDAGAYRAPADGPPVLS